MPLTQLRRTRRYIALAVGVLSAAMMMLLVHLRAPPRPDAPVSAPLTQSNAAPTQRPWTYGRTDARFTIIGYADFECPYCRAQFPVLRQWIDEHPHVNWQWRHLPLSVHEPAATEAARLAECAGELGGNAAFWDAAAWVYQHTRGNGAGLPANAPFPGMSPDVQACMDSARVDGLIQAQAQAAAREQITATPTLQVVDRATGQKLTLQGLIEGDALLSALDLLASSSGD